MDQPFPNKPVIHRRSRQTQGPPTLHDFEKISLSTQQRGHFSTKDNKLNGIQKTTGFLYSGEDSHRANRELQMARAIHAKELMLQGKLWKVGEKIRQTIQSQSTETAADGQHKSGEERQYWAQAEKGKVQKGAMLSEHERTEPGTSRDMLVEESRHGNFKQTINKQAQRTEDRMRNNPEVQQAGWEGAETPHSKDEGPEGVHVINEQKMNGVPNKTGLLEMNKYSRRKGDEKGHAIWEKGVINDSKQDEASLNNTDWTKEKNYRVRRYRNTYNNQEEMPQKSLEKSTHRWATENQESSRGKLSGESTLRPVSSSSYFSQQQQADEPLISAPDDNLQLLPCSFCNRTFKSGRLEKHTQICKNLKQRQVYSSSFHRTKGSQIEEFFKTNTRSKTPELPKRKKKRSNYQEHK